MKKAFLVSFDVMTRVVIDVPEGASVEDIENDDKLFDQLVSQARDHVLEDPFNYLCGDNLSETQEDEECPYGTFVGEE